MGHDENRIDRDIQSDTLEQGSQSARNIRGVEMVHELLSGEPYGDFFSRF